MWMFLAEELGKDGIPDAGMPKTHAEFLVTGRAFQAGAELRPACKVRVRVGTLEKTLYVLGNRYWLSDKEQSKPEPFVEMPIAWERAFGGEGFEKNPLGKGFVPIETERGPVHPLPNLERPDQLVTSKRDRPEPAGLGPIDLMWPQRFRKAGTHDDKWLRELFPGFAKDMDWSIFNIASADQQQNTPFRGDEPFVIEGMNAQKPRLEGGLPGIAARCFLSQRAADGEALLEVAMRLTTVWFFPHAERFLLVFHGMHPVVEDDATDVSQLMIAAEALGEARPPDHYQKVIARRLDPDMGALHALRDDDLLPSTPEVKAAKDEAVAEMQAALSTEGLLRKHQRAFIEREIEKSRVLVASLGLDPDVHAMGPLPPDEPLPNLEEIPELQERLSAEVERLKEENEQWQAEREAKVRELLIEEGLDANEILAEPQQSTRGPPTFSAEQELQKLRALSAECRAAGCPVAELDHYANDAAHRKLLVEGERAAREGYRQMAHQQDAAPRFSGEDAAKSRAAALATFESQGSLARLNLTGFDLSGVDLHGVDLSGAWLENADLSGANLAGARLCEAVLARADLTEAVLTDADLSRANLGLAQLIRTKADRANLTEAILNKARLDETSLRGARLESANLLEAIISATDMSQAELPAITFLKDDLRGLRLAGADLNQCNFIEVDVRGVDFAGARLEEATFVKSTGDGAVFAKARMANARFVQECTFEQTDFRKAILEGTNLRGTRLAGSDFSGARLAGADLSECDLRGAKLYRAFARDALLLKANLVEAVLLSADLMNAILQKADLSGADLRGANLFQADLARVRADRRTNFQDVNRKKVRTHPRRAPS